jgi:hypothetical protein
MKLSLQHIVIALILLLIILPRISHLSSRPIVGKATPTPYCPSSSRLTGTFPTATCTSKSGFGPAQVRWSCPAGQEAYATSCYGPCPAGSTANGPMCR